MVAAMTSILTDLPDASAAEVFTVLLDRPGVRIERIVSQGQVTPKDAPYDQDHDEWVLLLAGAARLWVDGEGERELRPGSTAFIPARVRHRVTWTQGQPATVWLAVHLEGV
jgi:cupin 2 domain-containing protein